MYLHDRAQTAHRMLLDMLVNEGVLHPDCLAKYAAAFFISP